MSYHFGIKKNKEISPKTLLAQLPNPNVQIAYSDHIEMDSPLNQTVRLYIPNVSTRGVSLETLAEEHDVCINVLANKEDYFLAIQLSATLARLNDSTIEPEDAEEPMDVEAFEKKFTKTWAEAYKTQGINAIKYLVNNDQKTITIGGCLRDYFIGPDMVDKIFTTDSEETTYATISSAIRRVQFIDQEEVRVPNRFVVTEKDGSQWEYIVLIPESRDLVCKTEFLILNKSKDEYVKVPFEQFRAYAEQQNFERLDELQYITPHLSETEFANLMKYFGHVGQVSSNGAAQKKWWEFWK